MFKSITRNVKRLALTGGSTLLYIYHTDIQGWTFSIMQEVIDEDDEKLKELRNEYGDTVFEAVGTALMEMNKYNASRRYPVSEVWNRKEERRAIMKEIVEYLIKLLKIHKGKRKRTIRFGHFHGISLITYPVQLQLAILESYIYIYMK
ncbi:hypothetical protein F3Y22_tig00110020pilonHSYRG00474 [Hibiscus syriacus]|uniref:Factor of DNA methylation 1-5/IDN2 domain-containing protein n=1 Tax=Hibiscus syriacus TaxID=106335 RepID=A0A6A3BSX6_HIBSY|nr:hypothetical protein F3Y22_tig00110020pilonHSYRG00474 [Hibiscus syriacus]